MNLNEENVNMHEDDDNVHEEDDNTHENELRDEENDSVHEEVYCINVGKMNNQIVYGGNSHTCTLFNIQNECPEGLIEGFSDSVIFCGYLENNLLLVCTIDGTLSLFSKDEIVNSEKIEEDITFVDVKGDKIFVGGSLGSVYIFSSDLSSHNVYLGHSSDIQKITYANQTVYALSPEQFIAFNEFSYQQKYRKNLKGATIFESIPGTDIFCVGKEGEILILKNGFLLNKFEVVGIPECIIFSDDHFIIGGSFPFILLINTKMNMREYKIRFDVEGCTKIQPLGPFKVAISTMCGQVGVGDIRKDDSFSFTSADVGSVFDFQCVGGKFYVGGAYGFNVVELD